MSPPSLSSLPEELMVQILGYIYKYSLIDLRFVDRTFSRLITPLIFRSIRFRACRKEPRRFVAIAQTEHLRHHVREITCDTWTGCRSCLGFDHYFFQALPFISLFPKLKTLNIRLADGGDYAKMYQKQMQVLETVFDCLAGTWNRACLNGEDLSFRDEQWSDCPPSQSGTLIPVRALTISNLLFPRYGKGSITSRPSFQAVMHSGTVKDLRLNMADECAGESFYSKPPDNSSPSCNPSHAWLTPHVASNLQVLSLFSSRPWGWLPKLDLRLISIDGLANLKVLALGKYEFSHWWQIEWFGSLGIEKLYLDECTVLHSEQNWEGMTRDYSVTTVQDFEGQNHEFSNEGYYVEGTSKNTSVSEDKVVETDLRWHFLFNHWANSMHNLRVFKIGQGHGAGGDTWKAIDPTYEGDFYEYVEEDHEAIFQPFQDTEHQYFECPAPLTTGTGIRRYGSEAVQDYGAFFPYVAYSRPRLYEYTEIVDGREPVDVSEEEVERDKKAFDKFLSVVETRRKELAVKG
ncbi:hypothetical protein FBEOM_6395 [Fusarium beomiforme]|uniref:F-box domain-containing protein n=1 Tax=Fusarium beomiforme TaxID=44412 RepID=A0A9P5DWD4_9HYPO|nr:hypothetical protein FBEOM_6395 [Fusarium beomiforme]